MGLRDKTFGARSKDEMTELREAIATIGDGFRTVLADHGELFEAIAELELALEERGWLLLGHDPARMEFSREGLDRIIRLSRLFWLKNPLVRRAVEVQNLYVWAQGVSIKAPDPQIDEVVQGVLGDAANGPSFASYRARKELERTRQVDGNVFFVFFGNETTGRVVVRLMPVDEVREIVTAPQDRNEVRFYHRSWSERAPDGKPGKQHDEYYPDWRFRRELEMAGRLDEPPTEGLPATAVVLWDRPVYHLRADALQTMLFGVPETYPSLDWARAYKETLEDFKKTVKSLSRWAHKLKGGGGQSAVDSAVAKLNSLLTEFASDSNPAPTTGSAFVAGKDVDLEAIDVSAAYVDPVASRPLLRMAGTSMGLPETFFGDASVGNQATAETLDRPTELKFLDCQTMWRETLADIISIAVEYAAKAGGRPGLQFDRYDDATGEMVFAGDVKRGRLGRVVNIDFPPILQRDVAKQIAALVRFVTLGNWPVQILDDGPTLLRLGLTALRVDNAEEIIEKFYPSDGSEPVGLRPLPKFQPRERPTGNNRAAGGQDDDERGKAYGRAPTGSATQDSEESSTAALAANIDRLRAAIEEASRE